jgi:hypothetical protein
MGGRYCCCWSPRDDDDDDEYSTTPIQYQCDNFGSKGRSILLLVLKLEADAPRRFNSVIKDEISFSCRCKMVDDILSKMVHQKLVCSKYRV